MVNSNISDIPYLMALSEIPQIGPVKQFKLLEFFKSAQNVFAASADDLLQSGLLKSEEITFIRGFQGIKKFEIILKQMSSLGVKVVSFVDPLYPKLLLQISSFPILLFYRGDLALASERALLAVVGSRKMTDYGLKVIQNLVPEFVQNDIVIVSGMAFGVDAAAHKACLQVQGKTIAVQAQGVDRGYPRANERIYQQIIDQGGCVISEFGFADRDRVEKFLFPRRNRLISGLSQAVLVVEAAMRSGALITARYALEQNRDVFAIPGGLYQKMSQGCLEIIEQGAQIVRDAQTVVSRMDLQKQMPQQSLQLDTIAPELAPDRFETVLEKQIYNLCVQKPMTIHTLIEETAEPAPFVTATITKMQLLGSLKEVEGRRFVVE